MTAHPGYALQAFDAAAIDYVLKPVYEERLARTLNRIRARQVRRLSTAEWNAILPSLPRVAIKAGGGKVLLDLKLVSYFELEEDKVWAVTATERHCTIWKTLREVEQTYPEAGMVRIQRNVLLRPEVIVGWKPLLGGRLKVRLAKGQELIVSRAMVEAIKSRVSLS